MWQRSWKFIGDADVLNAFCCILKGRDKFYIFIVKWSVHLVLLSAFDVLKKPGNKQYFTVNVIWIVTLHWRRQGKAFTHLKLSSLPEFDV